MTGGVKTSRSWRGVGAEATSANRVVKRIMRMEVVNEVMTDNKSLVETISSGGGQTAGVQSMACCVGI
jgi:hypothetical protein